MIKRAICTILVCFLYTQIVSAQVKQFTILNKDTHLPIEAVSVYYPSVNIGSTSNADGVVKIGILANDTLYINHISYDLIKLPTRELARVDTIFLSPKAYLLDDIVVYGYDLKKKINEVLDDYKNIYQTSSTLYECTYKESSRIDGTLSRLNQVQLNWWSKFGYLHKHKNFDKDNQLSVSHIDYSKNDVGFFVNKGFVENRYIISSLYMNWYLELLSKLSSNIQINKIQKDEKYTKIVFSTSLMVNNEISQNLENSSFVIDNESGAIIDIYWNSIYNKSIKNGINKENGEPYSAEVKRVTLHLSMKQLSNGKWTIGHLLSKCYAEIIYREKKYKAELYQDFFITKEQKGRKIRKEDIINLDQSFYKSFPTQEKLDNTIILSKEELEFINKK